MPDNVCRQKPLTMLLASEHATEPTLPISQKVASPSTITASLIQAKQSRKISFAELGKLLGRDEVAVAAIFYRQAHASAEDIKRLAEALDLREDYLAQELGNWPDRGHTVDMPRAFLSPFL